MEVAPLQGPENPQYTDALCTGDADARRLAGRFE